MHCARTRKFWSVAVVVFAGLGWQTAQAETGQGPLKVFILAGDSNCEGKAATNLLNYLIDDPATADTYKHLRNDDGSWRERDDVWIRYLNRQGKLTTGYGSNPQQIGIELQFGNVLGDRLDKQVLLIKTAWGGSGLSRNFQSPSTSDPPGQCYVDMIASVQDTLKNLKTLFPEYDEAGGYELAGFVWFSGWNDASLKAPEYEERLANLIKDVRRDLNAPKLPIIIGEMGAGGPTPPGREEPAVRVAQKAVANRKEFAGTIKYIPTADMFDMEAMAMFRDGSWAKDNKEVFSRRASDRPYHYMGSARTFSEMGAAMAQGMIELLPSEKK